jgi:hypothetical protein
MTRLKFICPNGDASLVFNVDASSEHSVRSKLHECAACGATMMFDSSIPATIFVNDGGEGSGPISGRKNF